MSKKSKFSFLTVALAASLMIGACASNNSSVEESKAPSSQPAPSSEVISSVAPVSSSEQPKSSSIAPSSSSVAPSSSSKAPSSSSTAPSSSSEAPQQYTVTFVVNGVTVQTSQVEAGETAEYTGAEPTKTGDAKYRFKGWDKDINAPITANTVFTAQFAEYATTQMIDDFESYEDSPSMLDEGWGTLGYDGATGQWTTNTKAAVSLGQKSEEGQKSLRFDAWENGVGYKFYKTFDQGEFDKSANALEFKLMAPAINTIKVLLHLKVTIEGQTQTPYFTYTIPKNPSAEYVDYTIPLGDAGWAMWSEAGKSIHVCADWIGVHEDDILPYLTKIEFYIQGDDSSSGGNGWPYCAFLDSAKFVTVDNPTYATVQNTKLFKTYTATLNNGHILRVDMGENSSATARVIDLETPVEVNGTILNDGKQFAFVSADNGQTLTFRGNFTNGGQLIKFDQAAGALASEVEDINLTAVQVVDDFESYTSDGKSYCQKYGIDERSGARGAYYSEYYNDNNTTSSPWGGNKWNLMGGEGDQFKLKQDASGAHSGKNYACLKNSSSNGMRYMQWGLFDGSAEKNSFRGEKMGFWAKTNGVVKKFYAYMYSQSAPTNATRDNYVKKVTFTETAAVADWKHYEVELNPNVVYYGYMMYLEANWSADSYLYLDDVEVYGANPYAYYVEPEPEKPLTLDTGTTFFSQVFNYNVRIAITGEGTAVFSAPTTIDRNGTYTIDGQEVSFTFETSTYVATYDKATGTLTYKSANTTGILSNMLTNVNFKTANLETAEFYDADGVMYYQGQNNEEARSGARGAYYCDYYSGSGSSPVGGPGWSLMGGNGDQLQLDKTDSVRGSQSLKLKRSSAGAMRFMQWDLYKGTAKPMTNIDKFSIYLKNPNASSVLAKISVYTVAQVTASNQTTDRVLLEQTLEPNTDWTKYTINLDTSKTYYGFSITLEHSADGTAWVNMDDAVFYSNKANPTLSYNVTNNVELNGTLNCGAATITLKDNGTFLFTCASLGAQKVQGTYEMRMNGYVQEIVMQIAGNTIIGNYYISGYVEASITVKSVTGSFASQFAGDDLFK